MAGGPAATVMMADMSGHTFVVLRSVLVRLDAAVVMHHVHRGARMLATRVVVRVDMDVRPDTSGRAHLIPVRLARRRHTFRWRCRFSLWIFVWRIHRSPLVLVAPVRGACQS